ncbi:endonuclease/exonuclease/phosphatase family domain-containing protein 1 [Brachyhypopomus gauderio]|uniref:endonuclease/exonuclease/phosphatase family domain-containing protein 1 n=1 Tax=Brachyhypopomus gauderio TaxID=698409 RepID=UPI0040430D94
MGGNLGCHRSIPKDPTDLCHGKRKFSAACNFSNILVNQERLNINTATEEELMTLPGVSRTVARNMVEYRERIGGFRKVEDLALVTGVGATKLEAIKLEICVSSRSGSSQHSPSSIRRDQEHLACSGMNINTATPAQLLSIRGITEKLARNIVEYRTQHGPFRTIEDLVKVPQINSSLLDKIRFQIFVQRSRTPSTNTNGGLTVSTKSQPSPTSFSLSSDELDLPPGGPTQMVSVRQNVEVPAGRRDGRAVIRVAAWDLQRCSSDKANNPGVREVVCMTILENDIKLLAVQDLADQEALDKFCTELNQPSLSNVCKWKGPRGLWKCATSEKPTGQSCTGPEFSGFLWDSSAAIQLKDAMVLDDANANSNGSHTQPKAYLAHFFIRSSELTMVNVHMKATSSPREPDGQNHSADELKTHTLSAGVQEILKGEKAVLVLGGFGLPSDSTELEPLRREKMSAFLPPSVYTNISTRAPQGSLCLDNIWASRAVKKIYTGHCFVVREGLTNPWIPDNWSWGGVASEHCPVVAELYTVAMVKELLHNGTSIATVESHVFPKHER